MGLAGKDDLVCPVNKIAAELGVIQNACGIDLSIFRLSLFTVLTLRAVLLFIPPLLSVICRKFVSVVGVSAKCKGHSVPLLSESSKLAEGRSLSLGIRRFAVLLVETPRLFISFCWLQPWLQVAVVKNPTSLA